MPPIQDVYGSSDDPQRAHNTELLEIGLLSDRSTKYRAFAQWDTAPLTGIGCEGTAAAVEQRTGSYTPSRVDVFPVASDCDLSTIS